MTNFQCKIPTNQTPESISNVPGYLMPARAFFFIIVEEPGKDGFLVRKVYASNKSPYLQDMKLTPLQQLSELHPEKYGMMPKGPAAPYSIAEHVMGGGKNVSPYISTSSIFPGGSPRFDGRDIFIDIQKAQQSGLRLISTEEILDELAKYKAQNPHLAKRIDKISNYVRDIDQEVLIHGEKVPSSAIFNKESLKIAQTAAKAGRVIQVVGIVFTAYDVVQASNESIRVGNAKPITAELIRQAGGWGAAWAGFKIGAATGAAVGIETGPGAVISGLVGGIIVGGAGYFGADWVADHIYEN